MAGFLDQFRQKVITSVFKEQQNPNQPAEINDKIALGVLLWVVAEADGSFLAKEKEKIEQILTDFSEIAQGDMPVVMQSIRQAAQERIDLHRFTREVSNDLRYNVKVGIVANLFRVACADKQLDHDEIEMIRKISGLLGVDHKDFIDLKIKIKEEFGIKD